MQKNHGFLWKLSFCNKNTTNHNKHYIDIVTYAPPLSSFLQCASCNGRQACTGSATYRKVVTLLTTTLTLPTDDCCLCSRGSCHLTNGLQCRWQKSINMVVSVSVHGRLLTVFWKHGEYINENKCALLWAASISTGERFGICFCQC